MKKCPGCNRTLDKHGYACQYCKEFLKKQKKGDNNLNAGSESKAEGRTKS